VHRSCKESTEAKTNIAPLKGDLFEVANWLDPR